MALPFPFDEADGDRPVADCRRSARPAFPTSPIEAIAVALRNGQGGTQARRCIVLSHSEQRIWDDIERFWADEAEEPERPGVRSPQREEPGSEPTALWGVIGVRIAIVLVLLGAPLAGLALAGSVAVGWAVSRGRRRWRRARDVFSLSEAGTPAAPPIPARRAVEWGSPFVQRLDGV
jgi:hypothetical protein